MTPEPTTTPEVTPQPESTPQPTPEVTGTDRSGFRSDTSGHNDYPGANRSADVPTEPEVPPTDPAEPTPETPKPQPELPSDTVPETPADTESTEGSGLPGSR